jgi:hypothetical protein
MPLPQPFPFTSALAQQEWRHDALPHRRRAPMRANVHLIKKNKCPAKGRRAGVS